LLTLEFDLDLVLLLLETDDFSFPCFLAGPVTASKIVGRSLIILNSRFLQRDDQYKLITILRKQTINEWRENLNRRTANKLL